MSKRKRTLSQDMAHRPIDRDTIKWVMRLNLVVVGFGAIVTIGNPSLDHATITALAAGTAWLCRYYLRLMDSRDAIASMLGLYMHLNCPTPNPCEDENMAAAARWLLWNRYGVALKSDPKSPPKSGGDVGLNA
jgi:hypothetical protein